MAPTRMIDLWQWTKARIWSRISSLISVRRELHLWAMLVVVVVVVVVVDDEGNETSQDEGERDDHGEVMAS